LGDVGQLVAQLEDAGVPVHLHVDGTPTHVPPGVDLSAYRIIQEALTNIMKHAGQAAGRVLIRYSDTDVSVEINDNGTAPSPTTDRLYPGHGIIGMRERVAVFGGDFSAGPNPAGGYRVAARLPYSKPAR
jgi:signal transduction histidine kinase